MPIRKLRLNAAEARQTSSYINQLCAEGVDLGADSEILAVADEASPLEITQGRDVGVVCDVPPLNVAVAIPICIVAGYRVIVQDYYIELPWGSVDLPCLREFDGHYYFERLRYPSREVLNHHFDNPFSLSPGALLEGVILGYSWEPIPDDARGEVVPVQFTIVDTLGAGSSGRDTAFGRAIGDNGQCSRGRELGPLFRRTVPQRNTFCDMTQAEWSARVGKAKNEMRSRVSSRAETQVERCMYRALALLAAMRTQGHGNLLPEPKNSR